MLFTEEKKWKVVMVGETGTGKTSLITTLKYHHFVEDVQKTLFPTISMKIFEYKSKRKINLTIWDIAGEKRFRAINRIFIKDAQVIVFVYSITDRQSFEHVKNYWYDEILKICFHSPSNYDLCNWK